MRKTDNFLLNYSHIELLNCILALSHLHEVKTYHKSPEKLKK